MYKCCDSVNTGAVHKSWSHTNIVLQYIYDPFGINAKESTQSWIVHRVLSILVIMAVKKLKISVSSW